MDNQFGPDHTVIGCLTQLVVVFRSLICELFLGFIAGAAIWPLV